MPVERTSPLPGGEGQGEGRLRRFLAPSARATEDAMTPRGQPFKPQTANVMVEAMLARYAEEGIGAFLEKRAPEWTGA